MHHSVYRMINHVINSLYIENDVANHPRVLEIIDRFKGIRITSCNRYTEIFNRKAQSFRLQKQKPSLILAKKHDNFLCRPPDGYHIGAQNNYYFSHMLNCIYDCRYCFLQGMYHSAHYVLFVNYEDFQSEIESSILQEESGPVHFFSGYDCDSLAFEPVSGFVESFSPLFRKYPQALLELRTKSTQVRSLLGSEAIANVVVAFSLMPASSAELLEHRAPSLERRLESIRKLQDHGWNIGLRFDPLVYQSDFRQLYSEFFDSVFGIIDQERLHSVSLGSFRLPKQFFSRLSRMYPEERLFASPLEEKNGMISYRAELEKEMTDYCMEQVLGYTPASKLFPCS